MDALAAADLPLTGDTDHPALEISEAIRIARVLCIFFMIFVHLQPGTADFVPDEAGIRTFDILRFFLVDSVGRASVALLSVIAGFLAVYSLRRETPRVFLGKKTRSLMAPLVLWNLIFITLILAGSLIHPDYIQKSLGTDLKVSRLPEMILGIGGKPANEPLSFLRDVFICALFTPLMLAALRRSTGSFVAIVGVLVVLAIVLPMSMRPSIPALYAAGVFIAVRRIAPAPSLRLTFVALVAFVAVASLLTWRDLTSDDGARGGMTLLEAGFNIVRLPAAIVFWSLALRLRGTGAGAQVARLEPYIFIAFCIHLIVSKVAWAGWEPVFGGYYGSLYPLFFFTIPVVVMVCAVSGARLADTRIPWLFSLLNGGRNLPTGRKPRPAIAGTGLFLEPART